MIIEVILTQLTQFAKRKPPKNFRFERAQVAVSDDHLTCNSGHGENVRACMGIFTTGSRR